MCVHVFTIDKYYYVFLKCVNKDIINYVVFSASHYDCMNHPISTYVAFNKFFIFNIL